MCSCKYINLPFYVNIMASYPKFIFIVPYRNREEHLNVFRVMMSHILEDYDQSDWKIIIAHQADERPFNRGAMKNIGFLIAKDLYPSYYQDITFIFNDVDTMPSHKSYIDYETTHRTIKHFYGFHYALGGIFSIKGQDFEDLNGFPCYWSWGFEDNVLQKRARNSKLTIDRSQFYKIGDKHVLQLVDGFQKLANRKGAKDSLHETIHNGIFSISNLSYSRSTLTFEPPKSNLIEINVFDVNNFDCTHSIENEQLAPLDYVSQRFIGPTVSFTKKIIEHKEKITEKNLSDIKKNKSGYIKSNNFSIPTMATLQVKDFNSTASRVNTTRPVSAPIDNAFDRRRWGRW